MQRTMKATFRKGLVAACQRDLCDSETTSLVEGLRRHLVRFQGLGLSVGHAGLGYILRARATACLYCARGRDLFFGWMHGCEFIVCGERSCIPSEFPSPPMAQFRSEVSRVFPSTGCFPGQRFCSRRPGLRTRAIPGMMTNRRFNPSH